MVKKRIKQALKTSFIIGIICSICISLLSAPLLKLLYNTNKGINYIKLLTPFFFLYYLEGPLASILTAINKIKTCTIISVTGIIIKTTLTAILCLLNLKIYSLIISEIINIIYVVSLNIITIKKELN